MPGRLEAGGGGTVEEPDGLVLAGDAGGGGGVEVGAAEGAATASAFSSPLTRNQTARAWLSASKVSVTRSGGGLGESRTPTAIASRASSAG